jgi:hypothetical protein
MTSARMAEENQRQVERERLDVRGRPAVLGPVSWLAGWPAGTA